MVPEQIYRNKLWKKDNPRQMSKQGLRAANVWTCRTPLKQEYKISYVQAISLMLPNFEFDLKRLQGT